MDFKTIDKSNYRECMELQVEESQKHFVADNTRSSLKPPMRTGCTRSGYTMAIPWSGLFCTTTTTPIPAGR